MTMHRHGFRLLLLLATSSMAICCAEEKQVATHNLSSEFQNGAHQVRVRLPDDYDPQKKYRVLYILPVEKELDSRFGDGFAEMEKLNAHNRYHLILVEMAFEKEPWFGDHATDPKTRQASYLKECLVPFIEKTYSTLGTPEGRLLFGFSKSGWGAFSLILTYPDFFGYAVAWDAPMMLNTFFGAMKAVYGTQEQLDRFRPELLAATQARHFQQRTRLVLAGEKDWGRRAPPPAVGTHTGAMHALLEKLDLKHVYRDDLKVPHRWDPGWMGPALDELMKLCETP
jgi:enterochelin esterase-like enzyme